MNARTHAVMHFLTAIEGKDQAQIEKEARALAELITNTML